MARVTPASGGQVLNPEELEEHEAYKVKLKKIDWSKGAEKYGGGDRLTLDWEFDGTENETVRDWIDIRLGQQQNGKVSKLRQMLNALAEKPEPEWVWFDPDTLEWGYDKAEGSSAWAKLVTGVEIIIRGHFVLKEDKQTKRYTIDTYQNPKTLRKRQAPAPATAGADDKEIPF